MPVTIPEAFEHLLAETAVYDEETQASIEQRARIEQCLWKQFGITRFFRVGSYQTGTAVKGHSQHEFFATIPSRSLQHNSDMMLRAMRDTLARTFSDRDIATRAPAVVVPLSAGSFARTEVVPAQVLEQDTKYDLVYSIPDGKGGWKTTSPDAYTGYVAAVDKKVGKKLRPLIRLLKTWKYSMCVPISSFYLEMLATQYAEEELVLVYELDVRSILRRLWATSLAPLRDPLAITTRIEATSTETQKSSALLKIRESLTEAERAGETSARGDINAAFGHWKSAFGGRFPVYDHPWTGPLRAAQFATR